MTIINEIRRRNVHRVALAYLAGSWLLIQVIETLFPVFGLSDAAIRTVVIVLAIGFVPAVIASWVFEWTPQGIVRDDNVSAHVPNTRLFDRVVIVVLLFAVGYFAVDKFIVSDSPELSIAILPLETVLEQSDPELGRGLADEVRTRLARIPGLRVAGRRSSEALADKMMAIAEIADQLRVAHVVDGTLRTDGDRIHITVQLTDVTTDTLIWSDSYDRAPDDIFGVQNEIVTGIAGTLNVNAPNASSAKRPNPGAYTLYVQARSILNREFSDEEADTAMGLLEEALGADPDYADAMILYARWLWILENDRERVRSMINRAIALDANNSQALMFLSFIVLSEDNDIEAAARYKERAHEIDPSNYETLWGSIQTLSMHGRPDLAAKLGEYLIGRDPLCLRCYGAVSSAYMEMGNFALAAERARDALKFDPGFRHSLLDLGQALILDGKPEEAIDMFAAFRQDYGGLYPGHLEALHDLGRQDEFDALLPEFLATHEEEWPFFIAQLYAWIGDSDEAFRWLEGRHDREGTWAIRSHLVRPWYTKLHDDPRWQALLEEYNMTPERLAEVGLDIRLPPGIR